MKCHGGREANPIGEFEEAAREPGCDDDRGRFPERVGKLVKPKPVPEKPGR
jgi:hypothetical protein